MAAVGAVVVVSAFVRVLVGMRVSAPAIFGDELIYAELSRALAESAAFQVRDAPFPAWTFGPLYPALLAPIYGVFGLTDAYTAAKTLNAVLMSLAAVPAYLLARRLLDRPASVLVAALAVAVPGMAYTTRVMTESLFYPLFLVAVLAILGAIERPTARRQALALAAILVACLGRAQAVALLPAFLTAGLLVEFVVARRGEGVARTTGFAVALRRNTIAACGCGVTVLVGILYTQSPSFGASHGALYEEMPLASLPRWVLYHVAELDLALGVIPFAAFLALVPVARTGSRGLLAFTAVTGAVTGWSVVLVAGLAAHENVARIQERYLFYVTPLYLIALVVFLRVGEHRRTRAALVAAAVAAALPAVLPLESVLDYRVAASTMALIPWVAVGETLGGTGATWLMVGSACAASLAFVSLRRIRPGYVIALTAANLIVLSLLSHGVYVSVSDLAADSGIGSRERSWVDDAVGSDANVTVLWSGAADDREGWRTVWQAEFFNRSVRDVVELGAPMPHLGAADVHRSGRELRRLPSGPLTADYVLADSRLGLEGKVVASNTDTHQALYRVAGPVRFVHDPDPR